MAIEQKTAPAPQHFPEISRRRFLEWLGGTAAVAIGLEEGLNAIQKQEGLIAWAYHGIPTLFNRGEIPKTFDNKATSGVIGDNNTVKVPLAEIQQQFPKPFVEQGNTLTFLFPFQLPAGTKAEYEKAYHSLPLSDPKTVPPEDRQKQEDAILRQEEIKQKGIKNDIDVILPKDTVILTPADSHIFIRKGGAKTEDPTKVYSTQIFFYDEYRDVVYVLSFYNTGGKNDPLEAFISAPTQDFTPGLWTGTNWKNLPEVKQGTPLLKTTVENQQIRVRLQAYKGQRVGPEAEIKDKALYLLTPEFFNENNVDGSKIIVLRK